jgi:RsiW-degrading membrane proteinase PrsW (M82 family)
MRPPSRGGNAQEILRSPVFLFLGLVAIVPPAIQLLQSNTRILYGLAIWSGVLWAMLLHRLFSDRELPLRWSLGTLLFTMLVGFPLLELYVWLPPNVTGWFLRSDHLGLRFIGFSLGVGVREEMIKSLPLVVMALVSTRMRNPVTGVVLGLMSGVGFAVAENVFFVFQTLDSALAAVQETGAIGYLVVPIYNNVVRMAMTPFLHGCFSGIFGYFIARAAAQPARGLRLFLLLYGLGLAALLHGLYDSVVGASPLLGMIVEAGTFFVLMRYLLRARGLRSAWQLGGGVFNRRLLGRHDKTAAWRLRVLGGPAEGRLYPLDGIEVCVGRDPSRCAVHLPDLMVSRRHASLSPVEHGRWRMRCLSDGLPVFLNGNEVEEAVVGVGDRLQVGATELLLEPAPDLPMAWPSESARRHTRI